MEIPQDEPLTKAKLYTTFSTDEEWTEMGVGLVSVAMCATETDDGAPATCTEAHLEMVDFENPAELLMRTPVVHPDAYVVQQGTILWWMDPQLGRTMACSFEKREGCEKIYGEIVDCERTRKRAASREVSGAESGQSPCTIWVVCRENLPAILSAATTNAQRFGFFVRAQKDYFKELSNVFYACQEDGDLRGMDLVAKITVTLLRTPFTSDGNIIAQFVENALIDRTVDIVQYAIGRRDAATGFVSFEERRAAFRNPLQLPEDYVERIHVLHACGYLKDLLPQSLDEGDAASSSLMNTFLVSCKLQLIEDVCKKETILPEALSRVCGADATAAFEAVAFLHDLCKTVKNCMVAVETKMLLFNALVEAGVIPVLRHVLDHALRQYDSPDTETETETKTVSGAADASSALRGRPPTAGEALQMSCDVLCGCVSLYPATRDALLADAAAPPPSPQTQTSPLSLSSPSPLSSPSRCVLGLLLAAAAAARRGAERQSAHDAAVACGIGPPLPLPGAGDAEAARRGVLRFWADGPRPPLQRLAAALAADLAGSFSSFSSSASSASSYSAAASAASCAAHGLRLLTAFVAETEDKLAHGVAACVAGARLVPAVAAAFAIRSRAAAHVQSSCAAFVAALLASGQRRLTELLLPHCSETSAVSEGETADTEADNAVDAAVKLFLWCCHRDNVLRASLSHLVVALCRAVHAEKSGCAQRLPTSPFVHVLQSGDDDSVNGTALNETAGGCAELAARVWACHQNELRAKAPTLAAQLERVLNETPEEAHSIDMECSSATSTFERGIKSIPESEFDALVLDYGVEVTRAKDPQSVLFPATTTSESEDSKSSSSTETHEEPPHKRTKSESSESTPTD